MVVRLACGVYLPGECDDKFAPADCISMSLVEAIRCRLGDISKLSRIFSALIFNISP